MTHPRLSPALDRLLVAIFVLAVSVPLVGTVAGVNEDATEDENREAAPPPPLPHDMASLAAWPGGFTKYFADNFAFRSRLVRWQAVVRVNLLRSSSTPDVLLGHDGWLFYGTDGAVEDYAGARPFSATELEEWRATLQHTQDWLDGRGIAFVFVLVPDKHWIYPERMPAGLNRHVGESRVDQLVTHLRQHSTVGFVDAREPLGEVAHRDRLYHMSDTHWNDQGAFLAYRQVMERIGPPLGLRPRERNAFELRVIRRSGFDLARMLGLRELLVEDDLQLEPRGGRASRIIEPRKASRGLMYDRVVTEGPVDGPRALVFRDSFGSALIPFLSEHFSRAVYLWQNNFDPAMVARERPAVVIQQWVGRHLYTATPFDAVAALDADGQQ